MAKRKRKKRQHYPEHPAHPYNWGQTATVAALWLLARLPYRLGLRVGSALGGLAYHIARERREITRRNLKLCFPEKSADERERLVRDNFRATGRSVVETALGWFGGPQVERIPFEVRGEEHIRSALATGRPVIMLSGHFLSVELAARRLPDDIPMVAMYKPMNKKKVMDNAMLKARRRNVNDAVSKDDTRGLLRSLKKGLPIWYAGDQDYGRKHSVFAPFFGVPAATITALGRLAKMTKASVVPLFFFRKDDGTYLIEFQPALENFPSEDDVEDATRMNRIVEDAVRRYPEQYLWMHRRFKRQASPETNLYQT
ncbi:lysophospholipid acyltransferase family protein [Aquisalimonas sp. APHAB1-3]|uniref:lysophospholipid acyltransferase family protein n=1 Tax=Aquisalimonas sp. APHAB1-3 TaxID=3402080 RepID=UPI003AAFFE8C